MSVYTVQYSPAERKPTEVYKYMIFEDGIFIAYYWHDHRGDDHGIEFLNGIKEFSPLPRRSDFLVGNGRYYPLSLTKRAVAYLEDIKSKRSF